MIAGWQVRTTAYSTRNIKAYAGAENFYHLVFLAWKLILNHYSDMNFKSLHQALATIID